MGSTACLFVSVAVVAIGILALVVGIRGDNTAAKLGGCFICVIGVLGVIACSITG